MPIHAEHRHKLDKFLEIYQQDPSKVVLFIGAGLSIPPFPSWKKVLENLITACHFLPTEKEELMKELDTGEDWLTIAQMCKENLKDNYWHVLSEQFDHPQLTLDEVSKAYHQLLTDHTLGIKTIVTTNYDLIPDQAPGWKIFTNISGQLRTAKQWLQDGHKRKQVVKIHGCITAQENMVLTLADYRQAGHQESIEDFLKDIFQHYTVLFLGFSLSDHHINNIIEKVRHIYNGHNQRHYALLNALPTKTRLLETKLGINIIGYDTSEDNTHEKVLLEFIGKMRDVSPLAISPPVVTPPATPPPPPEIPVNPQ